MNVQLARAAVLGSLVVALAACKVTEDAQPPSPSPAEDNQAKESPAETVQPPMNLNGQVAFAMKDLARRLDVPTEAVKLSGASRVNWRSGALGCPEPGTSYTEALVPGSAIYLQVDKTLHAYHARLAGEPFYCPRERVEPPAADEGVDPT
jgi:hypothetical protein